MREPNQTYKTAEDTLLLADALSKHSYGKVLEIGVGEGLIATTLAGRCEKFVGTDISLEAIRKTVDRLLAARLFHKCDLLVCDGAKPLRAKFDLCAFNPPYLPSDVDDIATAGGKRGIEVTVEWFDRCAKILSENGKIVFVTSSLSEFESLLEHIAEAGLSAEVTARRKLFFEEIFVIQATK